LISDGPGAGRGLDHGTFVNQGRDFRAERDGLLKEDLVHRVQAFHFVPEARVIEPAGHPEVHPPGGEVARRLFRDVAPEQGQGFGLVFASVELAGELAATEVGASVVFVEPHLAGEGDALGGGHRGGAAAESPVEVGDRRTEHIYVRAIEYTAEGIVTAGGGAEPDGAKLEHVPVEEDHQLPAM
jgi:hypothetical protein